MAADRSAARRSARVAMLLAALAGCRTSAPPVKEAEEPSPPGLVFEGSRQVSERALRSALKAEISRLVQRGFRKSDVDDLAFEVERDYRSRGYHFVQVDYEYSPQRTVIHIREGARVVLRAMRFAGNQVFSSEQLAKLWSSNRTGLFGLQEQVYVASGAAALGRAIEELYLERGYQEVSVAEPVTEFIEEGSAATVEVRIVEGRQHLLKEVLLGEVPLLKPEVLKRDLESLLGSAYVPRVRFLVESRIAALFADRGYPEARVAAGEETRIVPGPPERVEVTLKISAQPGPAVRVRKIVIQGIDRTNQEFIRSRILFKEGQLYDGSLIRKSFKRLFDTGLFKSVDLRLAGAPALAPPAEAQERDLIVQVVEGPSSEYFFELGFGSYDLARVKGGVRMKNLFGEGLIGRAEAVGSIRGAQATLGVTDPWFLRSEWTADLPLTFLYREEPSFTVQEEKVGFRLSRPIVPGLVGGFAYRLSFSHVQDFNIQDLSAEEPDLFLGALGPFLEYDSRDDIFAPTRGTHSRLFAEVGAPYFGGEIHFAHGGLSLSRFFQPIPGTVLGGNLQTEWIVPFASTGGIPIQERLFNGGENSVRSFRQSELGPKDANGEPLGGEVRNLLSLELRQRIVDRLSGAIFGDYGNVAATERQPLAGFRPAVGAGVRYGLPIGPVRLDAAFNPDRRQGESLYVIHFSVGMPF